jgi:hypothetical protein
MTKYRATFSNGLVVTRTSDRTYTHAWRHAGGRSASFAGSYSLAVQACSRLALSEIEIVAVDVIAPKGKTGRAKVTAIALPAQAAEVCNCLMCLAEGDNSPHRRRESAATVKATLDGAGILTVKDKAGAVIASARRTDEDYIFMGLLGIEHLAYDCTDAARLEREWNAYAEACVKISDRQATASLPLTWSVDHNGNYFADGAVRRYCVAYEGKGGWPANGVYRVTVDGFPIGIAATLEAGRDIAQAHNDR